MAKQYWNGDVGYTYTDQATGKLVGITAQSIQADLEALDGGPLDADLFTYGGDFDEGVRIHELLRAYPGPKKLYLRSVVASAGTLISLAFKKEDTFTGKMTRFMIHNARGFSMGDHNDLREQADHFERLSDMVAEEYATRMGKTLKEVKALMDAETWYMGQEIVDAGFAGQLDSFDDAANLGGSKLAIESARMEFRQKVQMWAGMPKLTADPDQSTRATVEALITSGSVDKDNALPDGADLHVKNYPVAKGGKVYRSSLRSIAARAAKDDPDLANWATAMLTKVDAAKGAKKLTDEEAIEHLKDKPAVFRKVAEAAGHGSLLINADVTEAVSMRAKLVAEKITDPLATITQLRADLKAVETDRRANLLQATFGLPKLETGQVNHSREYAETFLKDVPMAELAAKIEEVKKNPTFLKLRGELFDVNSEANLFVVETKPVDKKTEKKATMQIAGVNVEEV